MSSEMFFESLLFDGKATCKAHWMCGLYNANTTFQAQKMTSTRKYPTLWPPATVSRLGCTKSTSDQRPADSKGILKVRTVVSSLSGLNTAAYSLIHITFHHHEICYLIGLD
jgi:hypothetical protein